MIHLARFAHTPYGTFGRMTFEDGNTLYSCEDIWDDNWPNTSCIPPQPGADPTTYELVRDTTGRFQHYALRAVPGRTNIEIHEGNTQLDTQGCILLGTGLGWLANRWAVTNSKDAMAKLHASLGDYSHIMKISWEFTSWRGRTA